MSGLFNGQPIYNEIDGHACAWMRRLCAAGNISRGRVVEADIRELDPANIGRGRRFHAFAGIGLWDYALELAGWPDGIAVWTGSCPCQPFSVAGRGRGASDERHLWPAWFRLIRECRPPVIFGEQVASPAGRAWFDAVSTDLEGVGYAVGSADLCAAGVGAPHPRHRLYFVAHLPIDGRRERRALRRWGDARIRAERDRRRSADPLGTCELADAPSEGRRRARGAGAAQLPQEVAVEPGRSRPTRVLGEPGEQRREGLEVRLQQRGSRSADAEAPGSGGSGRVGDASGTGSARDGRAIPDAKGESDCGGQATGDVAHEFELAGHTRGFWGDADWLICRDGKARPVEPGTFPLAHGNSGRVAVVRPGEQDGAEETHWYNRAGALKCIGNAIVPQVAAVFIEAALRSIHDQFA